MVWQEKIDVKLNQNLWGLVAAYGALGAAEYWQLKRLCWLSAITAVGMIISVAITTIAYTYDYWIHKCGQVKSLKKDLSAKFCYGCGKPLGT
jgi:hypothetical protein